jgi:hypothetical protein
MIIIHNILFLLLLQLLSQAASGLEIPFNDSNIQYFGQWTPFHNSTASRWPGAYFKLSLENTKHVSLQFTNQTTNIITQLDSNPLVYHELNHDNTVVNLTPDLDHELDAGQTHELIVMATEIEPTLCSIHFQALDIDATGRLAKPKQEPPVLVEFIGHDLTLGIGTSKTLFTSFAFLTANDLLKVEHNYVASKSAKLIGGIEDTYFDTVPSSTPWGVVILLGSNDNKSDPDAYHQSLYAFLTRLRLSLDKQSPILVLSEPLGDMYRPTQQAVFDMTHGTEVEHVYFVDTTAWLRYGPTYYLNWVSNICVYLAETSA